GQHQRQRPIDSLVNIHTGVNLGTEAGPGDDVNFFQRGPPKPMLASARETPRGHLADLLWIGTGVEPVGTGLADDLVDEAPLMVLVCLPSVPEPCPQLVHGLSAAGALQCRRRAVTVIKDEAIDDTDG